ncbi:MAG TPA: hypothetical protein VLK85_09825 [Ramlibacter sp.]|nr:hypothetical protein [Ramlibacter sp.]
MQHQATFVPTGFGANDVQIMAGTFDDFSFDDVVQVLGLSRQCLRLLIRQGEAALSEVLLKAGQVLEARMPMSSDPENVFKTLFGTAVHGSGLSFAVYHTEPTGPFPMPRCRLHEVYARAKSAGQGAAVPASSVLRQAGTGADATVRLRDLPAGEPSHTGPRGSVSGAQAFAQPGGPGQFAFTPSQAAPEGWSKAVAAQLQPLLHEELAAVLAQVQAQAQTLSTLDGRLQSLPPLVAAELRLALAQHERNASASRAPPPDAGAFRGALIAMGVCVAVLFLAVVALAVKALR